MPDPKSRLAAMSASRWVVLAALIGNILIATTKFIAATITGSSAMLSEAVHSLVDTSNQALMLWGMQRARKPADAQHPFGYGMELYFWAFVVAILIFAIGAGAAVYEGLTQLSDPQPIYRPEINFIVLGLAAVFEGAAWCVAFREFRSRMQRGQNGRPANRRHSYFDEVRQSKDPTVFTVLFEDSVAVMGLLVAAIGLGLTEWLGNPIFDAIASLIIGLMLALAAALLARESKGLLIGEAASRDVQRGIRDLVARERNIININEILTMHLAPNDVLLNISIDFNDSLSAGTVEQTISRLEASIKREYPEIVRIFIEAQSMRGHLANLQRTTE